MSENLLDLLKSSLSGEKYNFLQNYIKTADVDFNVDGKYITGHLHYLPFDENSGNVDTQGFSNYIMEKIIAFCIPPAQRKIILECSEGESSYAMQLTKVASHTLKAISERKDGKRSSSGEVGELILFVLLEGILDAPTVASKPYLKMNGQDLVKGSDGVHVGYDGKDMTVYLGESKLSPDFDYCKKKYAESVKDYHANGSEKKNRDLSVISSNIDLNLKSNKKNKLEEELLYYLNPIKRRTKERNFREVNAIFLGFDHDVYNKIYQEKKEHRNNLLKKAIQDDFPNIFKDVESYIKDDIVDYNFHFFILPFLSVTEMQEHCENYLKNFSFVKGA